MEDGYANLLVSIENGGRNKAGWGFVGGIVVGKVSEENFTSVVRVVGFSEQVTNVGRSIRAIQKIGTEVQFFKDGVDDISSFGIDKEDVVIGKSIQEVAEDGMVLGMRVPIGCDRVGRVEFLLVADRIVVRNDVGMLKRYRVIVEKIDLVGGGSLQVGILFFVFASKGISIVGSQFARTFLIEYSSGPLSVRSLEISSRYFAKPAPKSRRASTTDGSSANEPFGWKWY